MKISYRTQVLITLRNLEKALGRGVRFNELVKACDFDGVKKNRVRAIVSKSLDSLDDIGLTHQIDAKMVLLDGFWVKLITTEKHCQSFIDDTIIKISELETRAFAQPPKGELE